MSDVVASGAMLLLPSGSDQVIEVTGEDRLTHLDATTTQSLRDARTGTATAALMLDANGNPLAMFDVLVLPDRVWIVTPGVDVTDAVMHLIAGRTFLADAHFVVTGLTVRRAAGDPTVAHRAWSGTSVVPEPMTVRSTPTGDTFIAADGAGVFTVAGPAAQVDRLVDLLRREGAVDADEAGIDAWRVASGRPAWGVEVVPPNLPEELGLLPTHVHLAKGCYPGQETVARMWMLGRPRRRLAHVRIECDADELVAIGPGWSMGGGREVVEVTTLGDDGRALALVPGSSVPGDRFGGKGGPSVEVLAIVGDDPAPPGHDPAVRRRRDRTKSTG